jgi:hypothetical protein
MKSRNTDLISWNNALSDGIGRSGTRYKLSYERFAGANAEGRWLIDVDDVTICTVVSAQDALNRSEGLEALRCIRLGMSCQISDGHFHVAGVIAAEMIDAAKEALTRSTLIGERVALSRNVDALQALSDAITRESVRRQRGNEPGALPLLN